MGTAVVLVHGEPLLRAFGVLPHPNVLGGLLAAALPLTVGLLPRVEPVDPRGPAGPAVRYAVLRDVLLWLATALIMAGILLSYSRSAWLALLCGAAYLVTPRLRGRRHGLGRRPTWRGVIMGTGIVVVIATVLLIEWNAVLVRLQPTSNPLEQVSIEQRILLVDHAFEVIGWRPLVGVGGNNFALAAERLQSPKQSGPASSLPVHNTYLLAQAELGPLGSIAWLTLMSAPLLDLIHRGWSYRRAGSSWANGQKPGRVRWVRDLLHRRPSLEHGPWYALAGCSLVVVAVTGLFDFYIWVNEPAAALWVIALALFTSSPSCLPVL